MLNLLESNIDLTLALTFNLCPTSTWLLNLVKCCMLLLKMEKKGATVEERKNTFFFHTWKKNFFFLFQEWSRVQNPECLCNWSYTPHTLWERLHGWQYWALLFHRLCFYGNVLFIFSPISNLKDIFAAIKKKESKEVIPEFYKILAYLTHMFTSV